MPTILEALQTAVQHHSRNELQQAEAIYRQILNADPNQADAMHLLGYIAYQVGQLQPALELITKAISLNGSAPQFHNSKGLVYATAGNYPEAIKSFQRATELKPDYVEAAANLATATADSGKHAEAEPLFQRALALDPNFPPALSNYGNTLSTLGRIDESIEYSQRAVKASPQFAGAYNNLGLALHRRGRLDESFEALKKSVEFDPNSGDFQFNRAIGYLLHGDFETGWSEYESRFRVKSFVPHAPPLNRPLWDGSPLEGKTIFVQGEQGLGDEIQFVRYFPMVAERGGRVIFQCHATLTRLMKTMEGISLIISFEEPLPNADIQVPLLSLPRIFKTGLDSIPGNVPYLKADPSDSAIWKERLASVGAGYRVGLVWSGSRTHGGDRFRSLLAEQLAPLADVPGVQYFSLQKDRRDDPPASLRLHDFTNDLNNFADTAALIDNLDLVISVDTSVVHLAGALGKPTWVLVPIGPDFRWLLGREDSPWYPSMRLFRETEFRNWPPVIERVCAALRAVAPAW